MGIQNSDFNPQPRATFFKHASQFTAGQLIGAGVWDGDPVFGEVSTFGIGGLVIHDAGDAIADFGMPFPELRKDKLIELAVLFHSTSTTTTDLITFKFHYAPIIVGETVLIEADVNSISFTAKAIPAAAHTPVRTDWYGLVPGTFLWDLANEMPRLYVYGIEADNIGTASADEVYIDGLLYRGTPNITREKDTV